MAHKGLILDFGGVITSDFSGALSAFCEHEGLSPDRVTRALVGTPEGRQMIAAAEAGRVTQHELEQWLAGQLGVAAGNLAERVLGHLRPRPQTLDLAKRARAAGIATAVLSNSWGPGGYDPYAGYDLAAIFDVVVISDQVGLRKPDPAIYELTAAKLGLTPADCVFVDDTPANLVAAGELGMAVVHFTGSEADLAEIERLIGIGLCSGLLIPAAARAQAAAVPEAALVRDWEAPFPVNVRLTLSVHGRGGSDPTFRIDQAGAVWRTSLTRDGPGTIRVLQAASSRATPGPDTAEPGTRVLASAWGPGAAWLLDALPAALGLHDDISGFDPGPHPALRELASRHPGLRVGRTSRLMEALIPAILEQKVTGIEAHRAWRILLTRFGTPPPGPAPIGMRVFPEARTWRRVPSWDWHRAGVEGIRAQTIFHAASVAESLERLLATTSEEADRKLRSIPGIGPWTAAETMQRAAGDPDAVSVGDYNLPKAVGWVLAGRQTTDDAAMLELLAPYAGHRHRVTRLVELSGMSPPRRGSRMPVRDYRSF